MADPAANAANSTNTEVPSNAGAQINVATAGAMAGKPANVDIENVEMTGQGVETRRTGKNEIEIKLKLPTNKNLGTEAANTDKEVGEKRMSAPPSSAESPAESAANTGKEQGGQNTPTEPEEPLQEDTPKNETEQEDQGNKTPQNVPTTPGTEPPKLPGDKTQPATTEGQSSSQPAQKTPNATGSTGANQPPTTPPTGLPKTERATPTSDEQKLGTGKQPGKDFYTDDGHGNRSRGMQERDQANPIIAPPQQTENPDTTNSATPQQPSTTPPTAPPTPNIPPGGPPPTIPQNRQKGAAAEMGGDMAAQANRQPGPTAPPQLPTSRKRTSPTTILRNAQRAATDMRSKKAKLRLERKKLEQKLRSMEGQMDDIRTSAALRILRLFFPSIYSQITGISFSAKNVKSEMKIAALEAKITAIKTAKGGLETVKGAGSIIEAVKIVVQLAVALSETIIGTIIVILCSLFLVIVIAAVCFILSVGEIPAAMDKIIKELNKVLEPLEKLLQTEKTKVQIRRRITQINAILAGKSQDTPAQQTEGGSEQTSNPTEEAGAAEQTPGGQTPEGKEKKPTIGTPPPTTPTSTPKK